MCGQSLSEIRGLLASAGLAPRQRYGQHFLVDLNLMRKLVAAAELKPGDVVLEVGSGTGSLTEVLLAAGVRVVGVEIDRGLQRLLRKRLGGDACFSLVRGDILAGKREVNPAVLNALTGWVPSSGGGYKLVANLPYQVATPLLLELLHCRVPFQRLVCTVQREVGERLAAHTNGPAYGAASVIAQSLATLRPLAILPPSVFWPRPKVESLILTIWPRSEADRGVADVPGFIRFVQEGFAQRRKMLRRILSRWPVERVFAAIDEARVSPEARPAELSPSQWQVLFRALAERRQ